MKSISRTFQKGVIHTFLIFFTIGISALYGQGKNVQDITLNFTQHTMSFEHLVKEIEQQSSYKVFIPESLMGQKQTLTLPSDNLTLQELLSFLQDKNAIVYRLDGNLLSFKENKTSSNIRQMKGQILAQDGLSLPGATVLNLNTNQAVLTDLDGNYSIEVNIGDNIEVSYVGYQTQVQRARESLNFTLNEDSESLEEIVVIGYGTVKKKDLTGAVSQVNGDLIEQRNTTQVSQALQGQIPGVSVTRTSNATGAGSSIRIRGITSIGDSTPLIIVDGVAQDNIDQVNSNDIAEISVLKDAAASSIYGARAAAGVIVITTKRAKKGEFQFSYKGEFGSEKPTALPKAVDYKRYMQMINEMSWNDAGNSDNGQYNIYAQEDINSWHSNNQLNPDLYPITDWQDILLKKSASRQRHMFSMSGGGERTTSRLSVTYDDNDGIYQGENFKRIMTRLNNTVEINSFLKGEVDFSYNSTQQSSPTSNPVWDAIRYAPVYAATWQDGRIAEGKSGSNAYASLFYGGENKHNSDKVFARVALHVSPLQGLNISGVLSPQLFFNSRKNFSKKIAYYSATDPNLFLGYINGHASTSLTENRNQGRQLTKQLLINYDTSFKDHNLSLLAGYEDNYNSVDNLGAAASNMELDNFPYLDLAPGDFMSNSGNKYETAYQSYFGRLLYNYADKYHFQANIRTDGSSRFHTKYRWGTFPSFSAGWTISNEEFMSKQNVFSFLKLRASWGKLGNERIGNYPYQSTIGFSNTLFYQDGQILSSLTAAQIQYAIENITWETTTSTDIGVDMYFLNNRLSLTADYYKKTTKDMLLELEIPAFMGFENPSQNAGEMYTTGWELGVSYRDQIKNFKYSVGFNVSDSKTQMGDLNGRIVMTNTQIIQKGTSYNEWYGYIAEGLFQNQEEIDNSALLSGSSQIGDVKYKDISGPDGVPDGIISADYDRVALGSSLPRWIYGGNIQMQYKGFDLGISFQGVGKRTSLISEQRIRPFQSSWTSPTQEIDGKYWSHYNSEQENLDAKYPRLSHTSAENNNYKTSSFWLINGAYFRIKNITLAYSLPKKILAPARVDNLKFYIGLNDFFTISDFPKGFDPETLYSSYITKSVNFGVSVNF